MERKQEGPSLRTLQMDSTGSCLCVRCCHTWDESQVGMGWDCLPQSSGPTTLRAGTVPEEREGVCTNGGFRDC